ncbi:MAG: methionyl-tRNA formyltransferase [Oscillospiraceae bacterium]|nr:methionyl-tRNA formyltransferase [Oscillospiraceae bacterium]
MRIIFMGTPDFAVPCLEALIKSENEVVGVFTQPDKPKGRGYELTPPPVKLCAEKYNVPVFQPKSMRDGEALNIINSLNAELIIVVAFGKILPAEILDSVKYGSINIHASLLPKLRGAAPIQWSILNGETETGVTSMKMDVGLDTGDMLLKKSIEITEDMTAGELHDKLSVLGAEVLLETLSALKSGSLAPQKQDDALSSYAPMLSKELSPIDFSKSAVCVHNQIRGLSPWPVAVTVLNGKKVKIHKSRLSTVISSGNAGELVDNNGRLIVACGDGKCIEILELQLEGKKKTDAASFLRGHKTEIGTVLGG